MIKPDVDSLGHDIPHSPSLQTQTREFVVCITQFGYDLGTLRVQGVYNPLKCLDRGEVMQRQGKLEILQTFRRLFASLGREGLYH